MPVFTAAEIAEQIAAYKDALLKLSRAQSYRTDLGQVVTRADLPEIRKTLEWLETEKDKAAAAEAGLNAAAGVMVAGIPCRRRHG